MKKTELDNRLRETDPMKARSWGKILGRLKRHFDQWAMDELVRKGHSDFTLSHIPLIMNIKQEGTNNNELASLAKISKQAMSKVVLDLLQKGYIETLPDPIDKRSTTIVLTDKGKRFVINARNCMMDLSAEYQKLLGKNEYENMISNLLKIMEYNENRDSAV